VQSGDGEHMNQPRRSVAVAHLRRDLMLIRDQKRSCERCVLTEGSIDRVRGVRPDPRKDAGGFVPSVQMSGRTLQRWSRDSNDCRGGEQQRISRPLRPRAQQSDREDDDGPDNRDPGKTAESGEKSAYEREVCGGDEWQLRSGYLRATLLPCHSPPESFGGPRNQSERLDSEWKLRALPDNLAEKRRAGRTRELNIDVLPDQRRITRKHDDLEIARPRL